MGQSDSFRDLSAEIGVESPVRWDEQHNLAAVALAEGKTQKEAAAEAGITDRTLRNWLQNIQFSAEVDRLSIICGAASKAERLRIAKRVVRQKCQGELVETDKDILDWVKYLQSETSGVVLNFPALIDGKPAESSAESEIPPPVAGSRPESGEESIN